MYTKKDYSQKKLMFCWSKIGSENASKNFTLHLLDEKAGFLFLSSLELPLVQSQSGIWDGALSNLVTG